MSVPNNGHRADHNCGCVTAFMTCTQHPALPDSSWGLMLVGLEEVARARRVAMVEGMPDDADPTEYFNYRTLSSLIRALENAPRGTNA